MSDTFHIREAAAAQHVKPSGILLSRATQLREEAEYLERLASTIDAMNLEEGSVAELAIKNLVRIAKPQGPMTSGRHVS